MGREFASRRCALAAPGRHPVRPVIVHVCDANPDALAWYERLSRRRGSSTDWGDLLDDPDVEAVYVAVPHDLHDELYVAIEAGKPPARRETVRDRPRRRTSASWPRSPATRSCSSAALRAAVLPRRPGGGALARRGRAGRIIEVRNRSGTPATSIRTSRSTGSARRGSTARTAAWATSGCTCCTCRCALGMDAEQRARRCSRTSSPAARTDGEMVPCDTLGQRGPAVRGGREGEFPLRIETKRIEPGQKNTWVLEVDGTEGSIAFTTKSPKTLRSWLRARRPAGVAGTDLGSQSAYPTITGGDLRVRLLRRHPADVGGVPRRARPRSADARPVPLRDARGGRRDASDLHGRAAVRRTARWSASRRARRCRGARGTPRRAGAGRPARPSRASSLSPSISSDTVALWWRPSQPWSAATIPGIVPASVTTSCAHSRPPPWRPPARRQA